jgi:hypothetical protein
MIISYDKTLTGIKLLWFWREMPTFCIVVSLSKVRTVLAREKVEKSIGLIETYDGRNDGHSTHNNKPINTINTRSKRIYICFVYACIKWLNIDYNYSNYIIKVARHLNLQISTTHTFRVDCFFAAVFASRCCCAHVVANCDAIAKSVGTAASVRAYQAARCAPIA